MGERENFILNIHLKLKLKAVTMGSLSEDDVLAIYVEFTPGDIASAQAVAKNKPYLFVAGTVRVC